MTLHALTDRDAGINVAINRRISETLVLFRTARKSEYRVISLDNVHAKALANARMNGTADTMLHSLAQDGDVLVSTYHPGD